MQNIFSKAKMTLPVSRYSSLFCHRLPLPFVHTSLTTVVDSGRLSSHEIASSTSSMSMTSLSTSKLALSAFLDLDEVALAFFGPSSDVGGLDFRFWKGWTVSGSPVLNSSRLLMAAFWCQCYQTCFSFVTLLAMGQIEANIVVIFGVGGNQPI